jgi:hypothetical protein
MPALSANAGSKDGVSEGGGWRVKECTIITAMSEGDIANAEGMELAESSERVLELMATFDT